METLIIAALKGLETSGGASFFISLIVLIIGGVLYFRKTNIDQLTSVGTLQQAQVKSLLSQIELLSEELTKARHQLAEIHEQNVRLMEEVRDSKHRIQELEQLLENHRSL